MTMRSLLSLLLAVPTLAFAQGGPPPGKGPGAMGSIDPSTVTTVTGTIAGVTRTARGTAQSGVQLVLKTAEGEIAVQLGPDYWVDRQKVRFAAGDAVIVKGSRIEIEGKTAIVAVTVTKGDATLVVRDAQGVPVWGGPGKGPGPGAR